MLAIRHARLEDVDAITEIYNDAVLKTVATFDIEPRTLDEQKDWFEKHDAKHTILVVELNGAVFGWASLSEWSNRRAYSDTAEVSLYVKEDCRGKGIGKKLLEAIVDEGRKVGLHTVLARIADGNVASIHLHESVGMKHIGVMKEVGWKFNRFIDVYIMQKIYDVPKKNDI